MSVLPIQTKFTGISRPQKMSFATFEAVIPLEPDICIIPGYFESGTVILGASINRTNGEPFPEGEIIFFSCY
jgi:hypothetical protein